MELIKVWLPLIILGFNVAMMIVIKFNDLAHLSKSVTNMENKLEKMSEGCIKHAERIAKIEGKIE